MLCIRSISAERVWSLRTKAFQRIGRLRDVDLVHLGSDGRHREATTASPFRGADEWSAWDNSSGAISRVIGLQHDEPVTVVNGLRQLLVSDGDKNKPRIEMISGKKGEPNYADTIIEGESSRPCGGAVPRSYGLHRKAYCFGMGMGASAVYTLKAS